MKGDFWKDEMDAGLLIFSVSLVNLYLTAHKYQLN